jgi:histidinol-phosphatase
MDGHYRARSSREGRERRATLRPVESRLAAARSGERGRAGVHRSELDPGGKGSPLSLAPLAAAAGRFRVVGDCIQHGLVCRGRLHLAVDAMMQPWDTAALVPCVREAGGVAASLEGDQSGVVFSGSLVSASDAGVLAEALERMGTAGDAPRFGGL